MLDVDELLWSFVFRSKDKVWVWIAMNRERPEKSSPLPAVIAPKTPVGYSGIAYHLLIRKPSFSVIIGARIEPSFRANNSALWVKKRGKRLILSVGIIPYGNTWHASYVRRFLFPNVLKCMRFVENSSYTAIIPNYCRLLARYHFKNHHYPIPVIPSVARDLRLGKSPQCLGFLATLEMTTRKIG